MKIRVFDPPMCCSTGVCGPTVDARLARFAADIDWLKAQGIDVERYNLAQQPAPFAEEPLVRALLEEHGEGALPAILEGSKLLSYGVYPTRAELASWAGLQTADTGLFTDAVAELVALGASVASGCEPCFKFHYDKARRLGVSRDDMRRAVDLAQMVKEAPARAMLDLADRYLSQSPPVASAPTAAEAAGSADEASTDAAAPACCAPVVGAAANTAAGGCC